MEEEPRKGVRKRETRRGQSKVKMGKQRAVWERETEGSGKGRLVMREERQGNVKCERFGEEG
jgi:hypothetical protein